MFSTVRGCEGNIKRYRNSAMSQRWLATALLHCEKGFRRVKGYSGILEVIATTEHAQEEHGLQKAAWAHLKMGATGNYRKFQLET
jgi:putative transposase